MKVLIINPIVYTSETKNITKIDSIKDTMIYNLCLAYLELGIEVTLAAAEEFKPKNCNDIPFKVIWMKSYCKGLFTPHNIPFNPDVINIIKNTNFNYIISSEAFSLDSLMASWIAKRKVIIWQELAKHNRMMHQIVSKIWYGLVVRTALKNVLVVPRSNEAKKFISQYYGNVSNTVVDHGVNLDKFIANNIKENYFVVSSQLIKRKHVDKIIINFKDFLVNVDDSYKLHIMGEGDEKEFLVKLVDELKIEDKVIFWGKLEHDKLIEKLKHAKAMLVNTERDNNMISIIESIAVGTPVVTTSIPYNASYIKSNKLGIVKDKWNFETMKLIVDNSDDFVRNCYGYREQLSTDFKVKTFNRIFKKWNNSNY